jgi:hypothetical protein
VDGKAIATTPITRYKIAVGKHRLTFVGPNGERKSVDVLVQENAVTTHFFNWNGEQLRSP